LQDSCCCMYDGLTAPLDPTTELKRRKVGGTVLRCLGGEALAGPTAKRFTHGDGTMTTQLFVGGE
jgi:hypothetical protein